ncbi:J domain-containing protein [Vulgatibacter incomptus]|uniref:Heat shock protein DnaJ domain protein n=1 Tax=Vulgatibacter incomptus TaxID=1391653 RepID=A0A0K1P8D8_9BACT|nr:J domain-containing protein [Vulgatibacter incomptus]AKU89780.1 heat shock protein DnaJ domain protein [Vulgatibacter incomptus]
MPAGIDPGEGRAILDLHARLPSITHFELLGVERSAGPGEVEEAYFELSKRFHPDRYYGRNLGPYEVAVGEIFRRLKEAAQTLRDPVQRRAYLASMATPDDRAEDAVTKARRAERSERLRRMDPGLRRAQTATELEARGRKSFAEGRWREAAADLSSAASLQGSREVGGESPLSALAEEARGRAASEHAAMLAESADRLAITGDAQQARGRWLEAARLVPHDVAFVTRAMTSFLELGGEASEARDVIQLLRETAPRDADAQALVGRALLASGHEKAGRQALEQALRLDPRQPFARSALRKWRWPFRS